MTYDSFYVLLTMKQRLASYAALEMLWRMGSNAEMTQVSIGWHGPLTKTAYGLA